MELSKHRWGRSNHQDAIWALVAGLRPSKAAGRFLMIFQAYVDESAGEDGTFVLAGHISTAEKWAALSEEWEKMLPLATLGPDGNYRFKMNEMARTPERLERMRGFYRIIEKYVIVSISCQLNVKDLIQAQNRMASPGLTLDFGELSNPYHTAFIGLMDMVAGARKEMNSVLPEDAPIDFIFDERPEKKVIINAWDSWLLNRGNPKHLYGATPIFRNDDEFLPLQAADLWAWWINYWYRTGGKNAALEGHFKDWDLKADGVNRYDVSFTQDEIVQGLKASFRAQTKGRRLIYDVKINF